MNSKDKIYDLQKNTKNIRNLCILAHVDHGKTTLADTLLANNGIISTRMSGKLRYMDSRQDEQERGITMKSSAISLIHNYSKNNQKYLINLIDSPGHVDFSTEVSTAVRLCDGAIILIDVCEGICPQTHAVLRQASLEHLKLVLILNKIDRLILELKMTPLEAYNHLLNILGQFNAIVAQQFTNLLLEKRNELSEIESDETVELDDEDIDESKIYFSPKYNNVFFASAIDGWGFGITNFADLYANKLGFKKETLLNTLWGDYYLNAKTKRIMKNAQANCKKPLFVQFILDNIWQVYDAVYTRRDTIMTEKILNSLNLKIAPRNLKYTDPKGPLQALFMTWLPLGNNLLETVVEILPSPADITSEKVENLISTKLKPFKSLPIETQKLKDDFINCKSDDLSKPVIVFISKMFATEKENISKKPLSLDEINQKRELIRLKKLETAGEIKNNRSDNSQEKHPHPLNEDDSNQSTEATENKHEFLAFARVFSGTLKTGQTLFILSPKYNPEDFVGKNIDISSTIEELRSMSKHIDKFVVKDLYLMMGRELELIDEVPCGNIVAIGGLENLILKSATLSSTLSCPSFTSMYLQTSPIVRVAIEPKNPSKMKELVKGLKLLNQADPCVEIIHQQNGEIILCTAGEVHLQRCIEDIVERFAKIEVNVSQAIVPFKETIITPPKYDFVNEKIKPEQISQVPIYQQAKERNGLGETDDSDQYQQKQIVKDDISTINPNGSVEVISSDKRFTLSIRAKPLPINVTRYLDEECQQKIKLLNRLNENKIDLNQRETIDSLNDFRKVLQSKFNESTNSNQVEVSGEANNIETGEWKDVVNKIIAFGPNRCGPNILLNALDLDQTLISNSSIWATLDNLNDSNGYKPRCSVLREYENSIIFGFNLATAKGPICEEPLQGVAFLIEKLLIKNEQIIKDQQAVLANEIESLNLNEAIDEENDETKSEFSLNESKSSYFIPESKVKSHQGSVSLFVSLVKDTCRKAFKLRPMRLMAAMYKCEIMVVNSEALGKLYGVLGKRNAKILDESIKDGTNMFIITAYLPVADSFGLAEEIRKRTSGLASPHIEFSHFEIIEMDPYWEPRTEEELLLYGDKADFENQAKKYMNDVRKRKGLFVKEKLVEHAEKQRNLTIK